MREIILIPGIQNPSFNCIIPMNRNITFFIASNSGSLSKKVVVSRTCLCAVGIICCICISVLGLLLFDYTNLKRNAVQSDSLWSRLKGQEQELSGQRKQIQLFASEINTLKNKIVDLNTFEKKIRVLANIEPTTGQENVFGIGGSIPEDLDPSIVFTKSHDSLLREMHEQVEQLSEESENQKENFESLAEYLTERRNLLAATPAINPTRGWVTSTFGYRKSPFTGLRELHKGLDISARTGTPVFATADGVITFSDNKSLLGNMVIVDHGHGLVTRYAHLNKIYKQSGDSIKRGDILGEVGNTGRTTGPHLHYDVRLNGISVNPEKYIVD